MSATTVIRDMPLGQVSAARAAELMPEEQFRGFYDRTARPLWAYLARITGDRQLADDLLQEAFYRFYRAGDAYESEAHRRNTLFRIGTNLARDNWRRHGQAVMVELPVDTAAARSSVHGAELRTDLGRALAQLKPAQREMLWLAYANGSSHQEIAEVIGVKEGSVKSLLLRARRKLAQLLGEPTGASHGA